MTTHCLSDQLECIELEKAANLVRSTQSTWRILGQSGLKYTNMQRVYTKLMRLNWDQYEPDISLEDLMTMTFFLNSGDQLKTSFYLPVLDTMLNELSIRFSDEALELMRAVQSCNPCSESFFEPTWCSRYWMHSGKWNPENIRKRWQEIQLYQRSSSKYHLPSSSLLLLRKHHFLLWRL